MSVEFFEPRPPKIAAIKLDFLNDPDREVAEKLRAMPLVDTVAIEYNSFLADEHPRVIVVNTGESSFRLSPRHIGDDHWLACTPPALDSRGPRQLEILQDRQFRRRYRPCESEAASV